MKQEILIERLEKNIKELEAYCKQYNEWPKVIKGEKKSYKEVQSNYLANWLYNLNYGSRKNKFLYPDLIGKDGEKIIDKIDELYFKYNENHSKQGKYNECQNYHATAMVSRITAYCETYNEWPKHYNDANSEKEKEANKLYIWLSKTHYTSNDKPFIYADVKDKTGTKIEIVLNRLRKKYNKNYDVQKAIDKVREIEQYCITYFDFPSPKRTRRNDFEKYTRSLYLWLTDHNYPKNFKYKNINFNKTETLQDRLDTLYLVYGVRPSEKIEYTELSINRYMEILEEYCNRSQEWPKIYNIAKNKNDIISNRLHLWLKAIGFNGELENFKYPDLEYKGELLFDRIKRFYIKYATKQKSSVAYTIHMTKLVEDYCRVYNEWPRRCLDAKTVKEQLSNMLYLWLDNSEYFNKEKGFKYKDIADDTDVKLESILNNCYILYSARYRSDRDVTLTFEEWKMRDLHDNSLALYYYTLKLLEAKKDNCPEEYNYYLELLDKRIKRDNLKVDTIRLNELLCKGTEAMRNYSYKKYTTFSIMNMNEEALYFNLLVSYLDEQRPQKRKILQK